MQKRQKRIIRIRSPSFSFFTTITITTLTLSLVTLQPPLRPKLQRVLAPQMRTSINRRRSENNRRSSWNKLPLNGRVAIGDAQSQADGRPEAEDFGAKGLEVVAGVDLGGRDGAG